MNTKVSPVITPYQPDIRCSQFSRYSLPTYLVKNYWWAYLSPVGVNLFDKSFLVNRILWGQYNQIAQDAIDLFSLKTNQHVAGISCAYGEFFPKLLHHENVEKLLLFDVAPIQIKQIEKKVPPKTLATKCHLFLSNAEQIALGSDVIDTSVLFFLLHELPEQARIRVLTESLRITKSKGSIIIADYAPLSFQQHIFHRSKVCRNVFEKLEPCLANFWRIDLIEELESCAVKQNKKIVSIKEKYYLNHFYRLLELKIE